METIGQTIKFIRESKHLSQETVSKNIMSRSNLSRFEAGHYFPGYDKLLYILERLGMTLEEALYIHNNYQPTPFDRLYQQLIQAENKGERETVRKIGEQAFDLQAAGQSEYELIYYTAQCTLYRWNEGAEELPFSTILAYVKKRLSRSEQWFITEFRLLNNFLDFFETEVLHFFVKRALINFEKYDQLLIRNNIQVHLLMNAGIIMLQRGELRTADEYLQLSQKYGRAQNKLYQVIICECYRLIIAVKTGSKPLESRQQLENNLATLRQYGYGEMAAEILRIGAL